MTLISRDRTASLSIADRYVATELIARGGMAEVHRGHDTKLDRPVAIKRMRPELVGNPPVRARFGNEAKAVAALRHPGIIGVYDAGEDPDPETGVPVPFLIMELVDGSSLREIITNHGGLSDIRALQTTTAVLDALAYSHAAGIVHRDIKPGNVLLSRSGQIKVTDFGIARSILDAAATATQMGVVLGTPLYMSPEQVRGAAVDARSDLYSVGCLLYETLTGRPPFLGDSPVSIAFQQVATPPVAPSTHNPTIGRDIDTLVLKALAKKPAERYQSADAMRSEIDAILRRRSTSAADSHRAPQRLAAVVAIAVLAAATCLLSLGDQPRTSAIPGAQPAAVQRTIRSSPSPDHSAEIPRSLTGQRLSVVVARLKAAGFREIATQQRDPAGHARPGVVTGINPAPGSTVPLDQTIMVTYTGSAPALLTRLGRPPTSQSPDQPRSRSQTASEPPGSPSRTASQSPTSRPRRPAKHPDHAQSKKKSPKPHKSPKGAR